MTNILGDLVIVLAAALPIVLVFQKLRLPTIVGFLLAGCLLGPHGIGLVEDTESVAALAEIGIVLLLFVVGLELSLRQLRLLGSVILWACTIQILGTIGLAAGVAWLAGLAAAPALIAGFLVTHSSTAIVLKLLNERGELDAPHGRIAVGILLVQDLALVPMVMLVRVLGAPGTADWLAVLRALFEASLAVGTLILVARVALPRLLAFIVRQRNRELFAATVVLVCFGTAGLAARFDLSLALGALLAGLVISESEYSHQIVADLLPFRDVLNSIFFVSIGMLFRPELVWEAPLMTIGLAALVLVAKALVLGVAILPFHGSARVATSTAFALASMGELAFVLAGIALPVGLIAPAHYDTFLAVAILTMVATPFLMAAAEPVGWWLQARLGTAVPDSEATPVAQRGHVLIVGYGLNGSNLSRVLRETAIPCLVVELNPESVASAHADGVPVVYGDAARPAMLEHAGLRAAAILVIAISDAVATRRIVAVARQLQPTLPIVVRTRYVSEVERLQSLGATEVIPEEFETSVEIFARVLRRLHVPRNVIQLQVEMIRSQSYGMLRGLDLPDQTLSQIDAILARALTETALVETGSPACGKTVRDLDLRHQTGVTILAVVHAGVAQPNPGADDVISEGDLLVLFGSHSSLDAALRLLAGTGAAAAVA